MSKVNRGGKGKDEGAKSEGAVEKRSKGPADNNRRHIQWNSCSRNQPTYLDPSQTEGHARYLQLTTQEGHHLTCTERTHRTTTYRITATAQVAGVQARKECTHSIGTCRSRHSAPSSHHPPKTQKRPCPTEMSWTLISLVNPSRRNLGLLNCGSWSGLV